NLEVDETCGDHRDLELCLQQSASDSPLPKIDVALRPVRYCFLDEDVPDLESPGGLEHAPHLTEAGGFVWKEIQHTIRDHHVGPLVRHRKLFGESMAELDVVEACLCGAHARLLEHRRRHVDTDNVARRSNHAGGDEAVDAGAGADVDHPLARP